MKCSAKSPAKSMMRSYASEPETMTRDIRGDYTTKVRLKLELQKMTLTTKEKYGPRKNHGVAIRQGIKIVLWRTNSLRFQLHGFTMIPLRFMTRVLCHFRRTTSDLLRSHWRCLSSACSLFLRSHQ